MANAELKALRKKKTAFRTLRGFPSSGIVRVGQKSQNGSRAHPGKPHPTLTPLRNPTGLAWSFDLLFICRHSQRKSELLQMHFDLHPVVAESALRASRCWSRPRENLLQRPISSAGCGHEAHKSEMRKARFLPLLFFAFSHPPGMLVVFQGILP